MPTLSTYGTKLRDYLAIWKKSGKEYQASTKHSKAKRSTKMKAGLTSLTSFELSASVLTVGSMTSTTAALSWTSVTNATTYTVHRSTDKHFPTAKTTQIYSSTGTSMTASALTPGTIYYFRVTASGSGYGNSVSIIKSGKTLSSLAAPATLVASSVATTSMTLTWAAVTGATGYILERATASNFGTGLTTAYTGSALTTSVTGLTTGTTYYFRVRATAPGYTGLNSTTTTQATS